MPGILSQLQSVIASVPPTANSELPTWGWATICAALSTAVVSLAGLYKQARDREVQAERSKTAFLHKIGDQTAELLTQVVEVATVSTASQQQLTRSLESFAQEIRQLQEEVRDGKAAQNQER